MVRVEIVIYFTDTVTTFSKRKEVEHGYRRVQEDSTRQGARPGHGNYGRGF